MTGLAETGLAGEGLRKEWLYKEWLCEEWLCEDGPALEDGGIQAAWTAVWAAGLAVLAAFALAMAYVQAGCSRKAGAVWLRLLSGQGLIFA